MSEKTLVLERRAVFSGSADVGSAAAWAAFGLLMELGAGGGAPGASALAAGMRSGSVWIYAGGAVGAMLHGFPGGFTGLGGLVIAFAGRFIPRAKNVRINCVVQAVVAAAAAFFPACAEYVSPSSLLSGMIAGVTAGVFAACVMLLNDRVTLRGFEPSENGDCALAALTAGIVFMTLGRLDFPPCNVGRLLACFFLMRTTGRRGAAYGAVTAAAVVFGLCASGCAGGMESGSVCLAAVVSSCLCRFGKITRAVGTLFFGCALLLTAGAEGDSWRVFAELAAAGAAYIVIPQRKTAAECGITENSAALMMRERLNFAAGALAGVNSGLEAAADTLERRYCESLPQVADKAADRACRSCPNNMVCWGQKYELFHREFDRLVKTLRTGGELSVQSLSPLAAAECINRDGVIRAVRKEYDRYLSASGEQQRIRELRRVYSGQLFSLSGILTDMGAAAGRIRTGSRAIERRAEKVLSECGLKNPAAFVTITKGGRMRLEAYGTGELTTEREYLGELLIRALGRELDLPEVSTSGGRVRVTAVQRAAMSAEIGACQLCRGKNRVCGDCFDSFTDPTGALYVVLSDGMGSGSRARIDSAMACSMASRLIKGGISLPAALEMVNTSLMVKSSDESYATLDICRLDLNSGECVIYKAGAAASYIKCSDRLLRACMSSSPAGTGGRLTVPAQKFRVSPGDMIIMTTDGAALDEEWLSRELSREERRTPQELSEYLARTARTAENGREDDISIIAVCVGR
ncbi:MAG: SpoIIE family protein phosphatase [Oscillospiraceae bacterium]|nr:SpoIIE family protein phosphatase [Oscillospiraceae bacterium]